MTGIEARQIMEGAVRRELFGPPAGEVPRGQPLDSSTGSHQFGKREDSWGLWHDAVTGQEILTTTDPLHRYGIGVLFAGATDSGTTTADGHSAAEPGGDGDDELAGTTGISMSDDNPAEPVVVVETHPRRAARQTATISI
jgi:hypothetical protein